MGISTRESVSLPERHHLKVTDDISLLVKLSFRTSAGAPFIKFFKHEFKDTFQKSDYCFGGENRTRTHLIAFNQADASEQNVFCYLDFCSYLKVNRPKSLPFVLKKVLFSKFIAKSTYRLACIPNTAEKKNR